METSVVFFGTGPVAADSLRLFAKNFTVEAVITKPRPPHHHGDVPVLVAAEELGLKVLTASNKHELDELFASRPVKSKLGVLIDFGIIVSPAVIDYFELGIVNSHFSVLPEWRGADPISFAILSGQPTTGVSLMMLVPAMDEGRLIAMAEYTVMPTATTPQLTYDLIRVSDKLLVATLPKYVDGELTPQPQEVTGREVSYSRKLTKDDAWLDWHKPAWQLEREVRAFAGWPRSKFRLGELDLTVVAARARAGTGEPGKFFVRKIDAEEEFGVHTSDGVLIFRRLIPAGKKPMAVDAFLAGYRTRISAFLD